jgi:hypothetical protein
LVGVASIPLYEYCKRVIDALEHANKALQSKKMSVISTSVLKLMEAPKAKLAIG